MSQFLNAPASSTNAIKSTVTIDALVFRWFLYLISQKKAKIDLVADGAIYARLKKVIIYQNLCLKEKQQLKEIYFEPDPSKD